MNARIDSTLRRVEEQRSKEVVPIGAGRVIREPLQEGPPAGLSQEEFMALSGLAPVPAVPGGAQAGPPPQAYVDACRAIRQCFNLEGVQHFAHSADALAAWARIYHEDRVSAEARRLKLHAYRRMGEIADQLAIDWRPGAHVRGIKGPVQVLREAGLSNGEASVARRVGLVPKRTFDLAIAQAKPPTPGTLVEIDAARSPGYQRVKRAASVLNAIFHHHPPAALAGQLTREELGRARRQCLELIDFLTRFEQSCGKRMMQEKE